MLGPITFSLFSLYIYIHYFITKSIEHGFLDRKFLFPQDNYIF